MDIFIVRSFDAQHQLGAALESTETVAGTHTMSTLVLLLLLGLLLPGELEALKCYTCGVVGHPDCPDPFVPESLTPTNCGRDTTACAKGWSRLKVVRLCAATCSQEENDEGVTMCCTTNTCNAAMMRSFRVTLIMTSLLVTSYKALL